MTKHFFDNRYGTGQSTLDGIIRATNVLLAGKTFVVAGYGWCGRGLASRAQGHGRQCHRDGSRSAARAGSGDGWFPGHADGGCGQDWRYLLHRDRRPECDRPTPLRSDEGRRDCGQLRPLQCGNQYPGFGRNLHEKRLVRPFVEEYTLKDGRQIFMLGEGRLINLAAAEGHPASVMDMSFANQALSAEYMVKNAAKMEKKVYSVPDLIDREIARLKLAAMGVDIDVLTPRTGFLPEFLGRRHLNQRNSLNSGSPLVLIVPNQKTLFSPAIRRGKNIISGLDGPKSSTETVLLAARKEIARIAAKKSKSNVPYISRTEVIINYTCFFIPFNSFLKNNLR